MSKEKKTVDLDQCSDQDFILYIYRTFHRLMFHIANQYVSSQHSEEIVQESIRKLIEKTQTLRGLSSASLANYVAATIRNTSIDFIRKQKREGCLRIDFDAQTEEDFADVSLTMDDLLIAQDHMDQLKQVWQQVDEETRYILEGKYILGYNDDELSKCLECKPSSVRMKLTRARRKVLNLLKGGEHFDEA